MKLAPKCMLGYLSIHEPYIEKESGALYPEEPANEVIRSGDGREAIDFTFPDQIVIQQDAFAQLQNTLAIMREVVESVADVVVIMDENGVVKYITPSITRMCGLHRSDMKGAHFEKYVHPSDISTYKNAFRRCMRPNMPCDDALEIRIQDSTGGWRWAEVVNCICADKFTPGGVLMTLHDVTPCKTTMERLKETMENAEKAVSVRDKFVTLVAHDLRSPLCAIYGLLNLLSDRIAGKQGADTDEIVRRALSSVEGMMMLIDDVLSVNRMMSDGVRPNLAFVSARDMAHSTAAALYPLAQQKNIGISVDVDEGLVFRADAVLFKEVLANLVSNAIKFTNPGGEVRITTPEGKRSTIIAVSDTGVGIPHEIIPSLFSKEVKTTTLGTAGEKGTGLGLPLCKEIIEAHGGSIDVNSSIGKGSVFYVKFPERWTAASA